MKLEKDKQLHLWAGLACAILVTLLGFGLWAFLATSILGIAKEVYDKYTPGRVVDKWDAVATAIPGIPFTAYFLM
jgi:hypothetical protein